MIPLALVWPLLLVPSPIPAPRFAQYDVPLASPAPHAAPRLLTRDQKRFRTVLREAISKGYGVVDGGTEHERIGPNFAGHFVLVQWGCGLSCMYAAVIDAKDGTVLRLPGSDQPSSFHLPTCGNDLRSLSFRTDSRLLGIPNCPDGLTYYFELLGHHWRYLGSTPPDR